MAIYCHMELRVKHFGKKISGSQIAVKRRFPGKQKELFTRSVGLIVDFASLASGTMDRRVVFEVCVGPMRTDLGKLAFGEQQTQIQRLAGTIVPTTIPILSLASGI
jgi:hypothetical protein